MKKTRFLCVIIIIILTAGFSGCVTELYSWQSFETQMYAYLKGESREKQIDALEKDRAKIEEAGKSVPPGFYAHLGMLYAEAGDDYNAAACFEAEKSLFPEAAGFMGILLAKYGK